MTRPNDEAQFQTKREWFAALAMQGILANPIEDGWNDIDVAESSVNMAEALIKELNRNPPPEGLETF